MLTYSFKKPLAIAANVLGLATFCTFVIYDLSIIVNGYDYTTVLIDMVISVLLLVFTLFPFIIIAKSAAPESDGVFTFKTSIIFPIIYLAYAFGLYIYIVAERGNTSPLAIVFLIFYLIGLVLTFLSMALKPFKARKICLIIAYAIIFAGCCINFNSYVIVIIMYILFMAFCIMSIINIAFIRQAKTGSEVCEHPEDESLPSESKRVDEPRVAAPLPTNEVAPAKVERQPSSMGSGGDTSIDVAERKLKKIKELKEFGLISEEDYRAKVKDIVDKM